MLPRQRLVLLVLLSIGSLTPPAHAHDSTAQHNGIPHEFQEPEDVARIFIKAVEKGQLYLFGKLISADMLSPARVEYAYRMTYPLPDIKVYAELKKPMPLSGCESCLVIGVMATLDAKGNISDSEAHVWAK